MRRFFYALGMACVLVGASLVLPRAAFASAIICPGGDSTHAPTFSVTISESPLNEASSCNISNFFPTGGGASVDLLQAGTNASAAFVSDYVDIAGFSSGTFTVVSFRSDGVAVDENGTGETSNQLSRRTGFSAVPEFDNNGAPASFTIPGTDSTNQAETLTLTTVSDLDAAVPEPSTGLLLASGLPAALGIWRFGPRRRSA